MILSFMATLPTNNSLNRAKKKESLKFAKFLCKESKKLAKAIYEKRDESHINQTAYFIINDLRTLFKQRITDNRVGSILLGLQHSNPVNNLKFNFGGPISIGGKPNYTLKFDPSANPTFTLSKLSQDEAWEVLEAVAGDLSFGILQDRFNKRNLHKRLAKCINKSDKLGLILSWKAVYSGSDCLKVDDFGDKWIQQAYSGDPDFKKKNLQTKKEIEEWLVHQEAFYRYSMEVHPKAQTLTQNIMIPFPVEQRLKWKESKEDLIQFLEGMKGKYFEFEKAEDYLYLFGLGEEPKEAKQISMIIFKDSKALFGCLIHSLVNTYHKIEPYNTRLPYFQFVEIFQSKEGKFKTESIKYRGSEEGRSKQTNGQEKLDKILEEIFS